MSNTNQNFYQRWQRLYHRRSDVRIYTNTSLVLLSLAILIIMAIQPTVQTILSLQKQIKDNRSLVEQMELKINRLNKLQEDYLEINDKLKLVDNVFPPQASPALLGRIIKVLAYKNHLILDSLNLAPYRWPAAKDRKPQKNPFIPYQAGVTLKGSYPDILAFFKDIENSQAMIKVASFNLKPEKGLMNLNATLVLEAKK